MKQDRTTLGLILIILGLLFLSGQTGQIIGTYWPMILVFIGLYQFSLGNVTRGLLLLVVGALFQLSSIFDFSVWSMFWPLIIIGVGISVLIGRPAPHVSGGQGQANETTDFLNETIVFWGAEKKIQSDHFRGGTYTCAFGGVELDLSEVKIAPEGARLSITCAFGGMEIKVPRNCRVEIGGTAVFGGWDNCVKLDSTEASSVLKIDGTVAFGGVEIKN